jgi:hypothetical protein
VSLGKENATIARNKYSAIEVMFVDFILHELIKSLLRLASGAGVGDSTAYAQLQAVQRTSAVIWRMCGCST